MTSLSCNLKEDYKLPKGPVPYPYSGKTFFMLHICQSKETSFLDKVILF